MIVQIIHHSTPTTSSFCSTMNASFSSTMSKDDIKESLLQKIDQYKKRKWIDAQEEEKFRSFLSSSNEDDDPITLDRHLQGVEKWLHAIEMAHGNDDGTLRSNNDVKNSKAINQDDVIKKASGSSYKLSAKDEQLRKKLLATIKVYKQRMWIDETEEDGLRSLLSSNKKDDFLPSTQSLETMEKRLTTIKAQRLKEEKDLKRKINDASTSRNAILQADEGNCADYYQIHNAEELVDTLSYDIIEQLFTEMCIFARMSFLQPTSCLECAFKQSQKQQEKSNRSRDKPCINYVVWRRDANICMHPDKLDDNLIIVSCSTAKAWIRGEIIQGLKWDKNSKQVLNVMKQ